MLRGDWGLGMGDWGLGMGDWAQSPIPNPQSPIPIPILNSLNIYLYSKFNIFFILIIYLKSKIIKENHKR